MLTLANEVVADLAVLSPEESASVIDTLMALRPHWVARNLYAPFYTLGAASYLDAIPGSWRYQAWKDEANAVLRENFAGLYDRLLATVERGLGEPATYASNLALPGFHIYLSSPLFERPVASIHCDSQFNLHDWPQGAELDQPISFTLSVELPQNGGGLYTWDIETAKLAGKSDARIATLLRGHERHFHPYRVGHLAMHSGNVLHQAAPGRELGPEDKRITLQGHGVRVDGIWQLYW